LIDFFKYILGCAVQGMMPIILNLAQRAPQISFYTETSCLNSIDHTPENDQLLDPLMPLRALRTLAM
jgi:hypothetical protein